jgi:hypothetical protein
MADKVNLTDDEKRLLSGPGGPANVPDSLDAPSGPNQTGTGPAKPQESTPSGLEANPDKGSVTPEDAAAPGDASGAKKPRGRRKAEAAQDGQEAQSGPTGPTVMEPGDDSPGFLDMPNNSKPIEGTGKLSDDEERGPVPAQYDDESNGWGSTPVQMRTGGEADLGQQDQDDTKDDKKS